MIDRDHAHDEVDDQDDYESCAPRNSIPFGLKEERERILIILVRREEEDESVQLGDLYK